MRSLSTSTKLAVVGILLVGLFFRFYNIDKKVFWIDEVYTLFVLAGYPPKELTDRVYDGKILCMDDMQRYLIFDPKIGTLDIIVRLKDKQPEDCPLFFVLARLWIKCFGDSTAVIRALSALLSLFVIPATYWLSKELFQSPRFALVAMLLISVSPFHILYAQEARAYSLWTVMILISSAALFRAMRMRTGRSWVLYAASMIIGLYTQVVQLLVAIAHAFYIVARRRSVNKEVLSAFALCIAFAGISYLPWLSAILLNGPKDFPALGCSQLVFQDAKNWICGACASFLDLGFLVRGYPDSNVPSWSWWNYLLAMLVFAGEVYSLLYLWRRSSAQVYLFVMVLIVVPAGGMFIGDMIFKQDYAQAPRYLTPCWLGVLLAVAYCLANGMAEFSNNPVKKRAFQCIFLSLLSGEIVSCAVCSQANIWWNKRWAWNNLRIAHILNQCTKPLVISNDKFVRVMTLPRALAPASNVRFQLVRLPSPPKAPCGFSDIFLYRPSESLKNYFRVHQYKLEAVENMSDFVRVTSLTK